MQLAKDLPSYRMQTQWGLPSSIFRCYICLRNTVSIVFWMCCKTELLCGAKVQCILFTVCEVVEENGNHSRIKVKVQEQLGVVEVKARRGQCCRGRGSHCPELAWTDFTPHSPGVQWQNLNPQCRKWLSVWHLLLRRYNFVNCWYFT